MITQCVRQTTHCNYYLLSRTIEHIFGHSLVSNNALAYVPDIIRVCGKELSREKRLERSQGYFASLVRGASHFVKKTLSMGMLQLKYLAAVVAKWIKTVSFLDDWQQTYLTLAFMGSQEHLSTGCWST